MRYLLVVNKDGKLLWHICDSKREARTTLVARHSDLLRKCQFDEATIRQYVILFEIEPNYTKLDINVSPPGDPIITISDSSGTDYPG